MRKKVTFLEINVYEGMIPLVSGYLQAYACRDPEIRRSVEFQHVSACRKQAPAEILDRLLSADADIYAFSCYVWNMRLVMSLLDALLRSKPKARFILGGPQVMHHAQRYLDPREERVVVCNGEGERVFSGLLVQFIAGNPDLSRVNGISFYRDGELQTTAPQGRVRDLNEIPSPFLEGIFTPGEYRMSVIETNRGCPFRCGFCYWGAANNDKVFKFSESRIRDEITWLAQSAIPVLHIADANWGMLKRDIALSQHIADCKARYYNPFAVIFAAAKNSPARVTEATRIFTEAGLVNTQPISLQSLDDSSLEQIDRSNIKLGAYAELQDDLNKRGIGSYIELIWPLPGETLASFKQGVQKLCERDAATIIVYAHLLLHNTPIFRNRKKHGLATRRGYDGAAEAEIIVQTADVSYEDFKEGMRFIYAVNALYNTHVVHALPAYLHRTGRMHYSDFFSGFAEFCKGRPDHAFSRFCEQSIAETRFYDFTNYPAIYHLVLHEERESFGNLLEEYLESQPWWQRDDDARAAFELDLVRKPFLYRNTEVRRPPHDFRRLQLLEVLPRGYVVQVPKGTAELLGKYVKEAAATITSSERSTIRVDHQKIQLPYNPGKSEEDRADYCSGMITRVSSILPSWSTVH